MALLREVYAEKGFAGWYQGLGAQIIKAVLCQGERLGCAHCLIIRNSIRLERSVRGLGVDVLGIGCKAEGARSGCGINDTRYQQSDL